LSKVWQLLCPNLETIIEGLAAKLFSYPLEMNSGCHLGFGSSKFSHVLLKRIQVVVILSLAASLICPLERKK
jgi:hypothetical protein